MCTILNELAQIQENLQEITLLRQLRLERLAEFEDTLRGYGLQAAIVEEKRKKQILNDWR